MAVLRGRLARGVRGGSVVGNERGAALIVTLMAMVLMLTLIVEFAYNTRVEMSMMTNHRLSQQGRYFAEVGVEAAKVLLASDLERDQANGAFIDYYAYEMAAEEEAGGQDAAGGMGGLSDMMAMGMQNGGAMDEVWALMNPQTPALPLGDTGAAVKLLIRDESGKVNLNKLDIPRGLDPQSPLAQQFVNFFIACGLEEQVAQELVPKLVDWIDADDNASTGGAESSYYQQLNPGFMARNAPIFSPSELRLIDGIGMEAWTAIAPHVTVYPREGAGLAKMNVNTAGVEALQFLDPEMTLEAAQAIVDERSAEPFRSMSEVQQVLSAYGTGDLFKRILGKIDIRSDLYSVTSSALVGDLEYTATAVLQRRRGSNEVRTVYWRVE